MKIGIGNDHRGYALKEILKNFLQAKGYEVIDYGSEGTNSVDYPDYAIPLAEDVANGKIERGILICNTGIGMSIAANKVKGAFAALVYNLELASYSRLHNNSNIITLGAAYISPENAKKYTEIWLKAPFEGGRHKRRFDKIRNYETQKT